MRKRGLATLATLVILGMNLPSGVVLAQQLAPAENKGVVSKPLGVVDLGLKESEPASSA